MLHMHVRDKGNEGKEMSMERIEIPMIYAREKLEEISSYKWVLAYGSSFCTRSQTANNAR